MYTHACARKCHASPLPPGRGEAQNSVVAYLNYTKIGKKLIFK